LCGKTIKEVGAYFGRGDAVFSRMIKKIEIERAKNNDLAKIIQQIEKEIKNSYRPCIMTTRGR
jgi:hypothetical protein